jgi:hypothetical protein
MELVTRLEKVGEREVTERAVTGQVVHDNTPR